MWLWQAGTGALLVVFLALHMIANHFVVEGGLRGYSDVVAYLSNPLVFVLETLFLIAVVAHALMGVRSLVLDLGIRAETDRQLTRWLMRLGIGLVAYATWLMALVVR